MRSIEFIFFTLFFFICCFEKNIYGDDIVSSQIKLLEGNNPTDKLFALEKIAELGKKEAIPAVQKVFCSEEEPYPIRAIALKVLISLNKNKGLFDLFKTIFMRELSKIENNKTNLEATQLLFAIMNGLGDLEDDRTTDFLVNLIRSKRLNRFKNNELRINTRYILNLQDRAIDALGKMGKVSINVFLRILEDDICGEDHLYILINLDRIIEDKDEQCVIPIIKIYEKYYNNCSDIGLMYIIKILGRISNKNSKEYLFKIASNRQFPTVICDYAKDFLQKK